MRAVVVYESMFGNTRVVAEKIGEGLSDAYDVEVVPAATVDAAVLDGASLVVVGGPTHAHGMTRRRSREAAAEMAAKPGSSVVLEKDATGPGVREWMASLGRVDTLSAAFDTRVHAPAALTGRAAKGIARELIRHGCRQVAGPESFLVTKENALEPGEAARARLWGETLAAEATQHFRALGDANGDFRP